MSNKILIADESTGTRESLINLLENAGYSAAEISNGLDALNLLREESAGLLITDINMEGLDGITLLKVIKEDKKTMHIPVIILSAETDDDLITEARLAGASAWIRKPFHPELIMEAVKKFLPL